MEKNKMVNYEVFYSFALLLFWNPIKSQKALHASTLSFLIHTKKKNDWADMWQFRFESTKNFMLRRISDWNSTTVCRKWLLLSSLSWFLKLQKKCEQSPIARYHLQHQLINKETYHNLDMPINSPMHWSIRSPSWTKLLGISIFDGYKGYYSCSYYL